MSYALTPDLEKLLAKLSPEFFGTVEIGYQNGHPGVVKITQTYKLPTNRDNRGVLNGDSR